MPFTMIVDPLLPMPIAMGWLVIQSDQHRISAPPTAGIYENRPLVTDWLNILADVVIFVVKTFGRFVESFCLTSPVAVWIRGRFILHDGEYRSVFFFPLPELVNVFP